MNDIIYNPKKILEQKIPENKNEDKHNILVEQGAIHTYKEDMRVALSGEQGALVKQTIEKEKQQILEKKIQTLSFLKNKIFLFFTFILILGGLIGGYVGLKKYFQVQETPVAPIIPTMIFFDDEINIGSLPTTVDDLISKLEKAYEQKIVPVGDFNKKYNGKVERILIGTDMGNGLIIPVNVGQFLNIIAPDAPRKLIAGASGRFEIGYIKKIDSEQKEIGIDPFMILELNGTDGSYQGLSEWEGNMAKDLFPILNIKDSDGKLSNTPFTDTVVANQYTRTLNDIDGNPVLMYSIINTNTALITTSKESFVEIIHRIQAPKS